MKTTVPIYTVGSTLPKVNDALRGTTRRAAALALLTQTDEALWLYARVTYLHTAAGGRFEWKHGRRSGSHRIVLTPQEAWEAASARDLIPLAWLDHPRTFFDGATQARSPWPTNPRALASFLAHPHTAIERAEALYLAALAHLRACGLTDEDTASDLCWVGRGGGTPAEFVHLHGWPRETFDIPPDRANGLATQRLQGYAWWEAHTAAWPAEHAHRSPYAPMCALFETPFRVCQVPYAYRSLKGPTLVFPVAFEMRETA